MLLRPRLATRNDLPALGLLMDRAIRQLQWDYLDRAQVEASRAIMCIDQQLVDDGTYWLVEDDDRIVGCGGWSRRATLFGGDHSLDQREPRLLESAIEPARIRAMYTDPDYARRGVGRLVVATCEQAARAAGFTSTVLMATLSGEPLYRACGYQISAELVEEVGGVGIPLVEMRKTLG